MTTLKVRLERGEALLHLDWFDYAERLFAGGSIDWSNPVDTSALINKAQALMPSDFVVLPMDRIIKAHILPEMRFDKPRGAEPLRQLLANARLRTCAAETVQMMNVPALVLGFPDPGTLAQLTAESAGLPMPEIDEDLVDDASAFLADYLRIFAEAGVEGIVLREEADRQDFRKYCAAVEKTAAAYGWAYAYHAGANPLWPGVQSVLIPRDSKPEDVLDRVNQLRSPKDN